MEKTHWKIEWSDALSMSNPEIDAEHRHFIELVNELNGAIRDRRDKSDIERIMKLILEDSIAHFSHEERLFVEKGFPSAQRHAQIHSELIRKFKQVLKEIHTTEFSREWIETGLTIRDLLVDHVLNEDTQYIEYLRAD
ncbi:MAG: bacteriohemerythrin [Candidatus Sedimenticola sp. (ex Thyasira tokunagai)]